MNEIRVKIGMETNTQLISARKFNKVFFRYLYLRGPHFIW